MMKRLSSLGMIMSGVLASACHTPSSVASSSSVSMTTTGPRVSATELPAASWLATAKPLDWSTPVAGHVHRLMPTPQTVAWGWYDAAGTPVLHVNSGDDVIVRALSTCNPTSLVRSGLDSNMSYMGQSAPVDIGDRVGSRRSPEAHTPLLPEFRFQPLHP